MMACRSVSMTPSVHRRASTSASPQVPTPKLDQFDSPGLTAGSNDIDESISPSLSTGSAKRQRPESPLAAVSATSTAARHGPSKGTKGKAKYIPNRVKRYHERSLAGCLTCRKRRVKCDETKPICRRCACGDRECIYAEASEPCSSLAPDAGPRKANSQPHSGIHVSSLIHPAEPAHPIHAGASRSPYLSPPQGVGPAVSSHHPTTYPSSSPQSVGDEVDPRSSYVPHNGRARTSTSMHHDRYRTVRNGDRHYGAVRQTGSDYDHHRPRTHSYVDPSSFGSSSIDISKVKLPELPPGLGFDHLDAYFLTYEQQCLFRHYILEVAPQLCVMEIPLSDNRWIRYHAAFAVRHPHGTNGYEDALRSALLSMASLDIGHKLSQAPVPDLFPAVASRPEDTPPLSSNVGNGARKNARPSPHGSTSLTDDGTQSASGANGVAEAISRPNTKSIMSNVLLELSNLRREESLRLLRTTLKERRAPLDRSDAAIMLATVLGLATRDRLAAQQDWQDALHIASRAIAELGGPAAFVDQSDPSSLFLIEQIACFDALSSLTSDDYTLFLQPWDDWWYALMDSPRSIKEDSVLQTFGLHRGMIDMLARMTRVEATRRELQERTSVTIILSETVGGGSPPALPPEYEETRLWLESTARALVAEIPIWAKMPFPAEATRTLQTLLPVIMNHLYVAAAELYIHSVIFSKPADHPCFAEPTAVVLDRTEEAIQAGITKG